MSQMPTVQSWANALREVFGVAEVNAAIRAHGYYASEAGVEAGTRLDDSNGVTLDQMVIREKAPETKQAGARRGR